MLRMLTTLILLISLLAGSLHAGHDQTVADTHHTDGCSLSSADTADDHTNHDQGTTHDDHCCGSHSHLQALSAQAIHFSAPSVKKQFTAVVPHLIPQDFSRIPFIPPRTTA